MSNITELSSEQLKRAANIKEQIEKLEKELSSVLGGSGNGTTSSIVTDDRRAKQSASMKKSWAKRNKGKASPALASAPATKVKRTMSPEARAKIAAAATKRWAAKKKVAGQA